MLPDNVVLRSEVAELDRDISDLRTRLAEKKARRRSLKQQLNSIIYPVLFLPPEITSEIFILCLPTSYPLFDAAIDPTEAPLLVSRVFSQWRQIALSTPTLWKDSLDIDLGVRRKRASDIVDAWLARAQNCPISVQTHGSGSDDLVDWESASSQTFRGHWSGMQCLKLNVYTEDLDGMSEPMDFPLLRKLSICVQEGDAELEFEQDLVKIFDGAPQLRHAVLDKLPTHAISLPWQQLQKFTGEFYLLSECLEALHLMPNIVECAFSMFATEVDDDSPETLSHSQIRTFTVFQSIPVEDVDDDVEVANSVQILAFITQPNLESLELLDISDDDAEIVASFLSRGSPPLKRLTLRPHFERGQAELTLSSVPLLQPQFTDLEIWFRARDFVSRFFERFGCDSGFLPGLQTLSFVCRKDQSNEGSRDDLLDSAAEPLNMRWDLHCGAEKL
ncbi:hypothetical protein FB45DRAFT_1001187 [Roridomyces roridus]|uniref:F-box domain-containing protein n=1 Tax=Roridomyces roridus TaxID=1738132 RepID=A0AAD7C5M5_9AGAR|nr:hypothetical protein FB45DRAFT_1001187 [Roridomyces roridus]